MIPACPSLLPKGVILKGLTSKIWVCMFYVCEMIAITKGWYIYICEKSRVGQGGRHSLCRGWSMEESGICHHDNIFYFILGVYSFSYFSLTWSKGHHSLCQDGTTGGVTHFARGGYKGASLTLPGWSKGRSLTLPGWSMWEWGWGVTHFAKMGLGGITHREEWSRGRHSLCHMVTHRGLCVKESSFSLPKCCVSGWSKGVLLTLPVCVKLLSFTLPEWSRKCHSFCRGGWSVGRHWFTDFARSVQNVMTKTHLT